MLTAVNGVIKKTENRWWTFWVFFSWCVKILENCLWPMAASTSWLCRSTLTWLYVAFKTVESINSEESTDVDHTASAQRFVLSVGGAASVLVKVQDLVSVYAKWLKFKESNWFFLPELFLFLSLMQTNTNIRFHSLSYLWVGFGGNRLLPCPWLPTYFPFTALSGFLP